MMSNNDEMYEKALHLDVVRKILDENAFTYVGGSVGLFLHGIRLTRWLNGNSDIDIWSPHFINLAASGLNVEEKQIETAEGNSGKDYKNVIEVTDKTTHSKINIDLGIYPEQSWEVVRYKGKEYRVNRIENIWAAKLKYKNKKHISDLKEALGIQVFPNLGL